MIDKEKIYTSLDLNYSIRERLEVVRKGGRGEKFMCEIIADAELLLQTIKEIREDINNDAEHCGE